MAVSKVSIINKALAHLGERPITSLSEGTVASTIADAIFENSVREVLFEHPWRFAHKRAVLAATGTTPAFEWTHEFELPNDFIRMVKTYPEYPDTFPHAIEGDKMYTNTSAPQVEYIAYIEEAGLYTPGFVTVLALHLAYHMAPRVKDSARDTQALFELYENRLNRMRSLDSQQGTPDEPKQDEWLGART